MYAMALALTTATTAATTGIPFFHLGALDVGLPIQSFGVIVAVGVLIGAWLLRRYAEWHGISDDHIRGLLGWVTVCGFLGAHEFDMIFYNWAKIGDATVVVPASWWPKFLGEAMYPSNWPLPLKIWEGISSYGGFIGGAIGFAIYVWWKRLPVRLFADVTVVGLLPAFSIGRIGCTVVSDHVGAAVDPNAWYAFLAMDYPRKLNIGNLAEHYPNLTGEIIKAWNLGLIEFLYLVPVNLVVLYLAFRPDKRLKAGFLCVLAGMMYAPIRFFLDFLRPEDSDPRHLGLTFAQWASILAFGAAGYVLMKIRQHGAPAEPVTRTAGEAQRQLRMILKDEIDAQKAKEVEEKAELPKAKATVKVEDKESEEDKELAKEAEAARGEEEEDDDDGDDEEAEPAAPAATNPTPAKKPGGAGAQRKGKKKKKKR